jgi:hypothetical protein
VMLSTNIYLAPKLIICEINPYFFNVEMNSTALSVAPVPMSRSIRHVIYNVLCWFFLSFCHVVIAERMVGLWGNLLLNLWAETSPISDEQSSPINTYQYSLLVPTNAHIILKYISAYRAPTCFGCSPYSVHGKNNANPVNRFIYRVEPGYNGIGLYDTSSIVSDILWYQLIPHC